MPDIESYDTIHPRDAQGETVKRIFLPDFMWEEIPCEIQVPNSSMLQNFNMKFASKNLKFDLIVLDDYGDETLTGRFRKRIFIEKAKNRTTVAVDRVTGKIWFAGYGREKGDLVMTFHAHAPNSSHQLVVPKRFRKELDYLLSCKRPFRWFIAEAALVGFADRWLGYKDLCEALSLELHLKKGLLQLMPMGDDETAAQLRTGWKW